MGGSVVAPGQAGPEYIQRLAEAIDTWSRQRRLLIVVGGGKTARDAIALARPSGATEEMLDRIGIQATRLNAQTLIAFLAGRGVAVNDDVPEQTAAAAAMGEELRVVVMGGTTPGHSTDFVGAELAGKAGAERLVIATNVDGVYDKDPRAHGDAQRIERLDFDGLIRVVGGTAWGAAGQAGVIDGPATALLRDASLTTCVVHGGDLDNLAKAIAGATFDGTLISEPEAAEAA